MQKPEKGFSPQQPKCEWPGASDLQLSNFSVTSKVIKKPLGKAVSAQQKTCVTRLAV